MTGLHGLRRRLDRLAPPPRDGRFSSKVRGDDGRLLRDMTIQHLRDHPHLLHVRPCDTDPATYARIQRDIALARGDKEALRAWAARLRPISGTPRLPGQSDMEWLRNFLADGVEESRREGEAEAAARRRVEAGYESPTRGPEGAP